MTKAFGGTMGEYKAITEKRACKTCIPEGA